MKGKTQLKACTVLLLTLFLVSLTVHAQTKKPEKNFTHADSVRGSMNAARNYDVTFYDLHLKIDMDNHKIYGANDIHFTAVQDLDSMQVDLFSNYKVDGANYEGYWARTRQRGNYVMVYFDNLPIKKGTKGVLKFYYNGKPLVAKNAPWDGGFVWDTDSMKKPWVTVACEGLGASSWWPCKDYLGDEPDSMRITCTIPAGLMCISNGQFRSMSPEGDGMTSFEWFVSYPINTYDVTLNIGDYVRIRDSYPSKAGKLDVDYFVLSYHEAKSEQYFKPEVKKMLDCFEKYFGPYPFTRDGYALVETPYWGMEHQSAVAYGNHFKKDTTYNMDFIIVHESAHEWWGNSISCGDQSEMWLHESFATYAEALYVECQYNYARSVAYLMRQRPMIVNAEPMIINKGVNYYNRPDNDIYYKGTWMLHSLRNYIGNDTLWFNILYTFQQKYKYKIVTTSDFTGLVKTMTNHDYDPFFTEYLYYAKAPELQWSTIKKGRNTMVTYSWKADVQNFSMPVDIQLPDGSVQRLMVTTQPQTTKISKAKPADIKLIKDRFYYMVAQ